MKKYLSVLHPDEQIHSESYLFFTRHKGQKVQMDAFLTGDRSSDNYFYRWGGPNSLPNNWPILEENTLHPDGWPLDFYTLNRKYTISTMTSNAALGNLDAAIADYTTCIEHGYELAQSYYQRAQVYAALGDTEKQNSDLENSLKQAN